MGWQLGGGLNELWLNNEVYMTDVDEDVEFHFAKGTTCKQQVFYAEYI